MEILQLVGVGLIGTFLAALLKEQKPNFSFLIVVFVGCVMFLFLVEKVSTILHTLQELAVGANINLVYLDTIMKVIGIAYIAEFASQISKDAGQNAIASRIELAGKIIILAMAVPIMTSIIESVVNLI